MNFQVAAGTAGAGTVTIALLGFGQSTPNWKQIREDLSDLINDDNVVNPSVDDGVQGGGGFIAPMLLRLAWHCSGLAFFCESNFHEKISWKGFHGIFFKYL